MPYDDDGFRDNTNYNRRKEEEKKNEQIRIEKEKARFAALSPEKREKEEKEKEEIYKRRQVNNYKSDLINLYSLADTSLSNKVGLLKNTINYETTYTSFKQTEFGEKLKYFLKKINEKSTIMGKSFSCNDYIDRTFSNILYLGFKESSIDCRGSTQIWILYNYILKFTSEYLNNYSKSQIEDLKKEFKKELSKKLLLICSGIEYQEEIKEMIKNSIEDQEIIGIPLSQNKEDLLNIYRELDSLFTDDGLIQGSLLNNNGVETEFKKKLQDFLKDITLNKCNKAIRVIFDKKNNYYFTGIFCLSYNKIKGLYDYLDMFKYKNEDDIQNLKKKLHESLIDICYRDKKIQEIIRANPPLPPETSFSPSPEAPPTEAPPTEVPAEAPPTEVKEKYMKYEEYNKGSFEEKEKKFNLLSPIFKLYVIYKRFHGYNGFLNILDNNLIYTVNDIILRRYEKIKGMVFDDTIASSISTKPVEKYDDLDKLIKKIYVDDDEKYKRYADYLRKKIENELVIDKIKNKINDDISKLQKSLDAYNKDISKLDNLLSENHEYIEDQNNTPPQFGGNTKITKLTKKDILGKSRCIYKKSGDRKQYIKHKGVLIAVSEYKKIMTTKNK
jgi:hypothetical protein